MALPTLGATSANAASGATWDRLAQCESSGDWHINTGNGYYGGLQFSNATWRGFGGTQYAARADLATRSQQIATAERTLAVQGWNAWPSCSRKLGLTSADKAGSAGTAAAAPAPARTPTARSTTARTVEPSRAAERGDHRHVVRGGETLSRIAAAHGQSWRAVYAANRGVIGSDPDLIRVGQVLWL